MAGKFRRSQLKSLSLRKTQLQQRLGTMKQQHQSWRSQRCRGGVPVRLLGSAHTDTFLSRHAWRSVVRTGATCGASGRWDGHLERVRLRSAPYQASSNCCANLNWVPSFQSVIVMLPQNLQCERPIVLTSTIFRLWRLQLGLPFAMRYDQARPGANVLRVALSRLEIQAAVASRCSWTRRPSFYDTISLEHLASQARPLEYPPCCFVLRCSFMLGAQFHLVDLCLAETGLLRSVRGGEGRLLGADLKAQKSWISSLSSPCGT